MLLQNVLGETAQSMKRKKKKKITARAKVTPCFRFSTKIVSSRENGQVDEAFLMGNIIHYVYSGQSS